MADYFALQKVFRELKVLTPDMTPTLAETEQGNIVIKTPALCQILINAPPDARAFQFGFGVMNVPSSDPLGAKGVEFRVYVLNAARGQAVGGSIAWRRELNPIAMEVDRGLHRATLRLPTMPPTLGVVLQTVPGSQGKIGDPFWTDLSFH